MTGNWFFKASIVLAVWLGLVGPIHAESASVKVATQIGLSYLPLIVMEHDRLWQRKAREKGLSLEVEYLQLGGGSSLNDALLSDSVQIVSGGLAPMLTMWDRTARNYRVKALSAINAYPEYLLTNKPAIKSIRTSHRPTALPCPASESRFRQCYWRSASKKRSAPENPTRSTISRLPWRIRKPMPR
jgi:ABC-type nitrate/sulfonate/bicarbonate transport system substrate-binding protein